MNDEAITFETLPKAISYLIGRVEALEGKLQPYIEPKQTASIIWFNIDELREYLPDHPARATVYGWVSSRQIPYHKGGKRLRFLKSEIDKWLEAGKRQSNTELEERASAYCETRKMGG